MKKLVVVLSADSAVQSVSVDSVTYSRRSLDSSAQLVSDDMKVLPFSVEVYQVVRVKK